MCKRPIRPIRVEGEIAFVPLTKGYVAVIDAADVHLVEGYNWCAMEMHGIVYARRNAKKHEGRPISIVMHRVIMGNPKGKVIDHIDRDGLNNRRANLRVATILQNNHNSIVPKTNTSGYEGAFWAKHLKRWRSVITYKGKTYHLGTFKTAKEAHLAYTKASKKFHGEFSRYL